MAALKMPKQQQTEKETPDTLEQEFSQLARRWRSEIGMFSLIRQKAMHPAYPKIIGMGKNDLPLILRELRTGGGDWLWSLESIARPKVNPALGTTNFKDTVAALLKWEEENGYA
jgi:hypothetical protein